MRVLELRLALQVCPPTWRQEHTFWGSVGLCGCSRLVGAGHMRGAGVAASH